MSKSLFEIPFVDRKFHIWYHILCSSSLLIAIRSEYLRRQLLLFNILFVIALDCNIPIHSRSRVLEHLQNVRSILERIKKLLRYVRIVILYLCILFIYIRNVVIKMSNFFFFISSVSLFRRFKSICFDKSRWSCYVRVK